MTIMFAIAFYAGNLKEYGEALRNGSSVWLDAKNINVCVLS